MVIAKIKFKNLENNKIYQKQKSFRYEEDAMFWLNNFKVNHIKIINIKIISNIELMNKKLQDARIIN